ncbi:biliverdin-producing heme oxygenase [Dyadobacter psychrotolerans]|uniref:Heme oxygenase n=1 Tax=Dyadobacter psychrotolerans TaxID=2541721 RepID=A0A4R5DHV3_9BACT|nr:biliverdin-producing heme oxygenase [Dyadobacter psychrotolerans]TDE12857.1 heme oxygenase [Dyadobacter psychrotolerans]
MNELTVSKQNQDVFLSNLRQETADSHRQLEENEFSKAILDPAVTLNGYQTYIAKLYGVTFACETEIYPILEPVLTDLAQRKKSQLIIRDLFNTGISPEITDKLPGYHFRANGIAEALGVMYVLEGSTLGGKILYKHINNTLGLDASHGASYFWGYGTETGLLWKTFISSLAAFAVQKSCEKEIISSAVQTFTAINNWLDQARINW